MGDDGDQILINLEDDPPPGTQEGEGKSFFNYIVAPVKIHPAPFQAKKERTKSR